MFKNLNINEKQTFKFHLLYSIIDGIIMGAFILNEFVFIKSLKGSDIQLGFLFQFAIIVFLISVFLNELIKRIENKKKLLRFIGYLSRVPIFFFFFFPNTINEISSNYHYLFLGIFLFYYLANPIIFPIINLLLKQNYSHKNFGKLYSYSTSIHKIMMLITTFIFGIILDLDNFSFSYIYPFLAILGMISITFLSKIKYEEKIKVNKIKVISSIKDSFLSMIYILKSNKPYKDFELSFMAYGIGFMISYPIITLFYEQVLELNYTSVAFYKNAYNIFAIILLPFFGKLMSKIDPRKFAIITFISLILFIFFVALTEKFQIYKKFLDIKIYYFLIISIFFHGFFAATMSLLWSIGSAYFCKKEEAADYQSIHLTLTGIRGTFAPFIGIAFYEIIGFFYTFMMAILFILIAVFINLISLKK